jgi:eukaryotic-like serine/threonine-protein kinase
VAEDVFRIAGSVIAGTYHVEQVVAEGGFAVVYRAHHAGFSAPVAMKCLKVPQQLSLERQAAFLAQFRAEAELLFQLSASIPNVVRPLHVDAMTAPDGSFVPYMVLEWLEGETLEAIVERRKEEGRPPLSLKKLVRMLTPVARALERAHNFRGIGGTVSIVHRDLKPDNIFIASVAGEEVAKVLDFGIAKAKSVASQVAGRASQTEGGAASFTPAYGAPEQWMPKRFGQTGPWTDVWGLALTMVEVMAARPIIDGDQAAMMGTALDERRRPTPRTEGVEVPDEVEVVFERALALDPRERPTDAGVFWDELLDALGLRDQRFRDSRAERGAIRRDDKVNLSTLPPPVRSGSDGARDVPTLLTDPASPKRGSVRPKAGSLETRGPVRDRGGASEIEFDAGNLAPLELELKSEPPPPDRTKSPGTPPVPSGPRPAAAATAVVRAQGPGLPHMSSARMRPPPAALQPPPQAKPEERPAGIGLKPGIALIVAGIALTLANKCHIDATGEALPLDPIRPLWIAGPLILIGVAVIIVRLLTTHDR